MSDAVVHAPADAWLPLLRRLTAEVPGWAVWKNAAAALAGRGDVDSVAPRTEWRAVRRIHEAWAREQGLTAIVACHHVPRGLILVALDVPGRRVLELDVADHQPFRGSTLFVARSLEPLLVHDDDGFRRLRDGAEGLLLLVLKGIRRGGRPHASLAAGRVPALLRRDPEGVREAARLLGLPARPALALATAASRGSWDRRAALALEARGALSSLRSPSTLAARVRYRVDRRSCAVAELIRSQRAFPQDSEAWLDRAARSHEVVRL